MPAIAPSANDPCHCGSPKKYKRCCRDRDRGRASLQQKLQDGALPFFAQVRTDGGTTGSLTVHSATVTRGFFKKDLLTAPITLSVNATTGNHTKIARARVVVPAVGTEAGTTATTGNAAVTMGPVRFEIALPAGTKKMKLSSPTGMFAIIRIRTQGDDGSQYFDVLFGRSGQSEDIGESGLKQRPHIAVAPDGNGKFLRLDGHQCEIESSMRVESSSGPIYPESYRIRSLELSTCIELRFVRTEPNVIELQGASFVA